MNCTPSKRLDGADRYIPSRQAIDFETSRFLLQKGDLVEPSSSLTMSPSKLNFQRQMAESLCGQDMSSSRVINYRRKAGTPNGLKLVQSDPQSPILRGVKRNFPQAPDRVLDAPDIVNDYYLNILDWSNQDILAVALGPQVYLWNAATGNFFLCSN